MGPMVQLCTAVGSIVNNAKLQSHTACAGPHSTAERKRYRVTTSSARARAWAGTGGSGAADFVYDEAAGQDEDHEDDKAASGASSAHGSSDSEEQSGGEGEVHHVRPRLRHIRPLEHCEKGMSKY